MIFLAMTVIAWLLLHKSKYGRKVFLVGVNPQAAEYSGINTRRVILSTYVPVSYTHLDVYKRQKVHIMP